MLLKRESKFGFVKKSSNGLNSESDVKDFLRFDSACQREIL